MVKMRTAILFLLMGRQVVILPDPRLVQNTHTQTPKKVFMGCLSESTALKQPSFQHMINKNRNFKRFLCNISHTPIAVLPCYMQPDLTFSQCSQRTSNFALQPGDGALAKECFGRGRLRGPLLQPIKTIMFLIFSSSL